jgi:hypothetical protein
MKNYEKLYFAANLLIDISEEAQRNALDKGWLDFSLNSAKAMSHQYCTVKICTARASGHTSVALKLMTERFKQSILVVPNMVTARKIIDHPIVAGYIEKDEEEMKISSSIVSLGKNIIVTPKTLYSTHGMQSDFEAVIVDFSWGLSKKEIDDIYDNLYILMMNHLCKYFIFLQ